MSFESYIDPVLDELRRALRSVDPGDFDRARELMLGAERIFVAGRGRAGLQMQAFAMRLMHLGLAVHVVGDVTTPGICLLYTSPSPRDRTRSRMPSSA